MIHGEAYLLLVKRGAFGIVVESLIHLSVVPTQTTVQNLVRVVKGVHQGHSVRTDLGQQIRQLVLQQGHLFGTEEAILREKTNI